MSAIKRALLPDEPWHWERTQITGPCERCHGTGEIILPHPRSSNPELERAYECPACNGSGDALVDTTVPVPNVASAFGVIGDEEAPF